MEVVVFVGFGLLVAYGVIRNWHWSPNNMVSAEDGATMTGRQLMVALGVIVGLVALAAIA